MSPIWIVNNSIFLLMNFVFLYFVIQISRILNNQIKNDLALGYREEQFIEQRQKMRNLWRIAIFFSVLSCYSLGHSAITYARAISEEHYGKCNVISGMVTVDYYFTFVIFFCNILAWQYPMIIISWPKMQFKGASYRKQQTQARESVITYSERTESFMSQSRQSSSAAANHQHEFMVSTGEIHHSNALHREKMI